MRENVLREKSLRFALRIINLSKYLVEEKKEYIISKQICKSGTSVGANIAESVYAASKADFINKLQIALKEAGETKYWLDLLQTAEYIIKEQYESIMNDCEELLKLLTASLKTNKKN